MSISAELSAWSAQRTGLKLVRLCALATCVKNILEIHGQSSASFVSIPLEIKSGKWGAIWSLLTAGIRFPPIHPGMKGKIQCRFPKDEARMFPPIQKWSLKTIFPLLQRGLLSSCLYIFVKHSISNATGKPTSNNSSNKRYAPAWSVNRAGSVLGPPVALLMECEWGISSGRGWLTQSISSVTILACVETESFLGKTENQVLKE